MILWKTILFCVFIVALVTVLFSFANQYLQHQRKAKQIQLRNSWQAAREYLAKSKKRCL